MLKDCGQTLKAQKATPKEKVPLQKATLLMQKVKELLQQEHFNMYKVNTILKILEGLQRDMLTL
jgi:hypothetical protein